MSAIDEATEPGKSRTRRRCPCCMVSYDVSEQGLVRYVAHLRTIRAKVDEELLEVGRK